MKQNSIWAKNTALPTFPPLERDETTDILILGGGMAGLLCAFFLQQAGARYLLIEADRICHGVTRNTTAKITSQHGLLYARIEQQFGTEAARLYWQANEDALLQYHRLCRHIDCGFEEQSAYTYSTDLKKLEAELNSLQRLGIPADYASDLPLPFQTAGAIRFRHQAQFDPLRFAAGIAHGLNIREQTAAKTYENGEILTDHGRIRAGKIIVATHFPLFNKHGSYFLKLYQHRSYLLALENAPLPDGMYWDESMTGLSFRRVGNTLLLGGGAHRTGKPGGGWQALTTFAAAHYPGAQVTHRWAAQDCMTLDGVPYIGQYSARTPNLFVATGFNKWGMSSAMVAARLLTDLVQEKPTPYARLFSPSRTMLRPQLAINAGEALLHLATPTTPRCPHLGCALKWNPQEHSWDCPCHGSRFASNGALLDNPATGDHPGPLPDKK